MFLFECNDEILELFVSNHHNIFVGEWQYSSQYIYIYIYIYIYFVTVSNHNKFEEKISRWKELNIIILINVIFVGKSYLSLL
ncbi:hypothetical protein ACMBCM_05310, partial [Spiroplasma sp. K1]